MFALFWETIFASDGKGISEILPKARELINIEKTTPIIDPLSNFKCILPSLIIY
jgi:hypothetical protein